MNYKYYQKKINDILNKAPIEGGVEILVYMLLDEIIENKQLSLVAIDSLQGNNRFISEGGFSDLAVVSEDFNFKTSSGECRALVETKYVTEKLSNHIIQIWGQLISFRNVIATNGIIWKFYDIDKFLSEKCDDEIEVAKCRREIESKRPLFEQYKELIKKRTYIKRIQKNVDVLDSGYNVINDDELKKEIEEINRTIQLIEMELNEIQSFNPVWEVELCVDDKYTIDPQRFSQLMGYLYNDWI